MQTDNNDRNYYMGDDADLSIVCIHAEIISEKPNSNFVKWLNNIPLGIEDFDDWEFGGWKNDYFVYSNGVQSGYNVPEDWKYSLIDYLCCLPTIDEVEIFIGELGIRKAFKLVDEYSYYEEENYKEALTTDDGLRRLFYCILDVIITINPKLTEITKKEYNNIKNRYEDSDNDEEEDSDNDEDE